MLSGLCVLFHRQLKLKGNTVNTNTFSTSQIVKWVLNLISQYTELYQEFDGFYSTSLNCKVKIARFYEFLFTLGWKLIKNKSLYKFLAPKHHVSFRVFTVRDNKMGMLLEAVRALT